MLFRSGNSHPAHIHNGAAVEGGAIAVTLTPVVGGKSTTAVSALDNGTSITYGQLIAYDGYINVHESATDLITILAQGDIGGNAFTGTTKTYHLDTVGTFGVSGNALLEKRNNGTTLLTVTLTGTPIGIYPAGIRLGSVATVGANTITKTLASAVGSDGVSATSSTNIRTLDDLTTISYDQLLVYDGYIAIEQSLTNTNVICKGNIGTH